ncbi:MAG: ABC transporter ATP-binding protein [Bacteroidales bacterium]|nr:ABC transporter ATP-binding protein [Bacteroidales bacterium]
MKQFFQIFALIKPYWVRAAWNVVFNILSAFAALFSYTLVAPFLGILFGTQPVVTEPVPLRLSAGAMIHNVNFFLSKVVTEHGRVEALLTVAILVVIMALLKNGFAFLSNWHMAPIRAGIETDLRKQLYRKLLRLPLSYYSEARKGDVMSRISADVKEIENSIVSSLEMLFRSPIVVIIYMVTLFVMSYKLTLFVLVLLPVSGWAIGKVARNLRGISFGGQRRLGSIMAIIEETLSGFRIIKAFNAEKNFTEKFDQVNARYFSIMKKVHRRRYLSSPLSEFLATIVMMLLMYYGGRMVLNHTSNLSSQEFIAYIVIFSQVIPPAKTFSLAYFNIQKGLASFDRINTILNEEEPIKDTPGALPLREFNDAIEYREVYFKYEHDYVLRNINLKINKGSTVALVGESGGGKSTVADLLPRFIEPTKGTVLLDGHTVQDYKISDLRNLMGIVNQQPILFNDTFYNNITMGMDVGRDEVIKAAKIANAHDFILSTPEGYDTSIGEGGNKLSGGQKQRISIARALLKNPPILILDEATSSLDTESEKLVQDAMLHLMKNRTSLVIAHRLSTIKNADEICVLHHGEIVERGTHTQLMRKKGYYHKLQKMQSVE